MSIEHMKDLKKKPLDQLQTHFDIIIHVLSDKLYIATGIENERLDQATEDLGLEEDPEYKALEQDYTQQVAAI
jgi:nucleotidyltransferase/DNA polymerase involved in DNA repair